MFEHALKPERSFRFLHQIENFWVIWCIAWSRNNIFGQTFDLKWKGIMEKISNEHCVYESVDYKNLSWDIIF